MDRQDRSNWTYYKRDEGELCLWVSAELSFEEVPEICGWMSCLAGI